MYKSYILSNIKEINENITEIIIPTNLINGESHSRYTSNIPSYDTSEPHPQHPLPKPMVECKCQGS